jgi:tetratricopeptide (TPR) repeat protein
MIREWFNVREATEIGAALADEYALPTGSNATVGGTKAPQAKGDIALLEFLRRAEQEVRVLRLNFYQRAKFANSFKWKLLEHGIEKSVVDEVTQRLVLQISLNQANSAMVDQSSAVPAERSFANESQHRFGLGNKHLARGAYDDAIAAYQDLLLFDPSHVGAMNNIGAALAKAGRYKEAENQIRQTIRVMPEHPDAHNNLGTVLRSLGQVAESEIPLRRALKLKPNHVEARISLGMTFLQLGRLRDARDRFKKVLKTAPGNAEALFGMGQADKLEGRFDEAGALFKRVLEIQPKMPGAWAALAGLRRMTFSDNDWLKQAEAIAASEISVVDAADLHFAIGKYHDDVENFERAFQSYKRANELQKTLAEPYQREFHTRFVDDLLRVYTPETVSRVSRAGSDSTQPVFVVGMKRSGTSLVEQILASHSMVKGAGELAFWSDAVHAHETTVRQRPLDEPQRKQLAEAYLRTLAGHAAGVRHVVDKTPVNSDYLGIIHSVFPNAHIIYMRRDPIDTCLSCYFQHFSVAENFTMDMSDLAHYYREHQRLMAHWRAVLPPGTILDVPYAELVANQEEWTRKILKFLGLEWDERCLDFHKTERAVLTASYWQVRQKTYKDSVQRWRKYEKFIKPLLRLKDPQL